PRAAQDQGEQMGTLKVTTPSDREIVMTRVFDAPRKLVFDAHTKPDLVKRWLLGPPGWSMPVCEIDLRVGGKYRYVWRQDNDGTQMGMGGVYREIVAPEQTVNNEHAAPSPVAQRGGSTRGVRRGRRPVARHRSGAACAPDLSALGPGDGRLALPAGDGLSHRLRCRGRLRHRSARARSAHEARR